MVSTHREYACSSTHTAQVSQPQHRQQTCWQPSCSTVFSHVTYIHWSATAPLPSTHPIKSTRQCSSKCNVHLPIRQIQQNRHNIASSDETEQAEKHKIACNTCGALRKSRSESCALRNATYSPAQSAHFSFTKEPNSNIYPELAGRNKHQRSYTDQKQQSWHWTHTLCSFPHVEQASAKPKQSPYCVRPKLRHQRRFVFCCCCCPLAVVDAAPTEEGTTDA